MNIKAIWLKTAGLTGLSCLLAGCVTPYGTPDNTGTGALVGAASGATIGAIASRGNPAGVLIGGAAGAITGGLIGHSVDEENAARAQYYYYNQPAPAYYYTPAPAPAVAPASAPKPLTAGDVKSMARSGVNDDTIINQIYNTRSVYHLDPDAIIDLRNSGVSQTVISVMINTPNSVATLPPANPQPAVAAAASPGPNYVWVAGEWAWSGGAWVWVSGRWLVPPYPHAMWMSAHWVRGPYGWRWAGGHWA